MIKISSKLRVTEVDSFSDALVRLYKADSAVADDAFLKTAMADIECLSSEITTAINQDKVRSSLEKADGVRDDILRNLGSVLDGYAAIPLESKKAAETLRALFAKYRKTITSETYAAESSLIESLLEDFASDGAKAAAQVLDGVPELLSQLRAAQDAFNTANDEYTAATGSKKASASSLKKPLLAAINETLVPYVTAMAMAQPAIYKDFETKADMEAKRINEAVSRRAK